MNRIIKLTESDLFNIISRVISEEPEDVSKKGSLKDIAKKMGTGGFFSRQGGFAYIYPSTQNDNFTWEVVSSEGGAKIAGSKPKSGTYFKSSDFIDLTNGGEITFVVKGERNKEDVPLFIVKLGSRGIVMSAITD